MGFSVCYTESRLSRGGISGISSTFHPSRVKLNGRYPSRKLKHDQRFGVGEYILHLEEESPVKISYEELCRK